MKHKDKLKMARKMLTRDEIKRHVKPFDSVAWEKRKKAIEARVAKREAGEHERALKRKLKIKDDKGKEHKVGEIFESKTVTIET